MKERFENILIIFFLELQIKKNIKRMNMKDKFRCLVGRTKNFGTSKTAKKPCTMITDSKEKEAAEFVIGDVDTFESGDMMQEGWKEGHASYSEAIVKAERHVDKNPEELQKDSVEYFEKHRTKNSAKKVENKG